MKNKIEIEKEIEELKKGCRKMYSYGINNSRDFVCGDRSLRSNRILYCPSCRAKLQIYNRFKEIIISKDAEIFALGNGLKDFKLEAKKRNEKEKQKI